MKRVYLFVFLVFVPDITNCDVTVECSNSVYMILNATDRAASHQGVTNKCDRNYLTKGWYRFMGDAGYAIATSCVPEYRCGTDAAGWMQGSHPTQEEGIVNRTVCYHCGGNCCRWTNNIRVRNCGQFYVYELDRPPSCPLRYCGNGKNIDGDNEPYYRHVGCFGDTSTRAMPNLLGTWSRENAIKECAKESWKKGYKVFSVQNFGECWSGVNAFNTYAIYGHSNDCSSDGVGGDWANDVYAFLYFCASDPCRNGGTCINTDNGYNCSCLKGRYSGSHCEASLTQCNSSPCRNGGSCYGDRNQYSCNCQHGYTGKQCETNLRTSITCTEKYLQIDLKNLYFSDYDWRNLHLKDPSCRAVQTPNTVRLRAPLDSCGTTYTENQDTIIFLNEVGNDDRWRQVSRNASSSSISRKWNIALSFYCEYERRRLVSTSFKPSRRTVVASEGSYGNFTFAMDLYQTSSYSTPYSIFAYPVVVYPNQPLWVQYEVKNTNADLVVFAENCRATTTTNPDSYPQHVFLRKGCISDSTMVYFHNPYSKVQRFSIRSFRFAQSNLGLVYLHCELIVCHQNSTNSRCAVGCIRQRNRRETNELESSMTYDLSAGPIKGHMGPHNPNTGGEAAWHPNTILIAVLVATVTVFSLITMLFLIILYRTRKRDQRAAKPSNTALSVTLNSYEQENVENDEKNESHT